MRPRRGAAVTEDARQDTRSRILAGIRVALRRFFIVTLLLILPLALAQYISTNETAPPAKPEEECRKFSKPEVEDAKQPVELGVRQGQVTTLAFGRSYETKRLTLVLEGKGDRLIEPARPRRLAVAISEFRRDDDARFLPTSIRATAQIQGNLVRMRVCINRVPEIDPGTYTGSFTLSDPRVRELAVPLIITLAYPDWAVPSLMLYGVILAGTAYVYGVFEQLQRDETFVELERMSKVGRWTREWGGVVAIVGGSAAAISAYTASYLASPDWGSSFSQFLGLTASMFTAFVTAASATQVASKTVRGEPGKKGS